MQPFGTQSQVCRRYNATQKRSDELNKKGFVIDQNITTLAAYVNYTVKVEAINEVGYGEPYEIIAQTDIGVAKEVVNITLNDLDVTWIPGEKTGPTRYEVVVREEDYRNRGSYNEILRENVIGYNNTTLRLRKVFAYWNYNISIQAHTDKGALSPIALNVKTPPKGKMEFFF
ncbi:hypothetical protein PoB_003554600 [Plakobranchus ocellatus]|uniref:Fibronectin type-III domain-containing protein n=1 Tax=Plakobranchus ocellatus TaxID=259542 RepID=A0AAV4AD30_9GAST|nr:hypothetical protein PoB_003554600 [Plakobranchus ocellatus]